MKRCQSPRSLPRPARGFSLVELLVSMVIGLVVTLAVFGVLAASEGRKRTSVSVNDANQSGAYAVYTLDRMIRSAGSGYAQGNPSVMGCRINAVTQGGLTLPRAAAFPAPFAGVPQTVRLAPVIIFQSAAASGSDVLMVMNGSAGFGESPATLLPRTATDVTSNQWRLSNTIGYGRGDPAAAATVIGNNLLMIAGGGECLLSQLITPFTGSVTTQALPFNTAGPYYTNTGTGTSMAALAALSTTQAFAIGSTRAEENPPQFLLYGVGDNSTLFSYDLLVLNGQNAALPLAEGAVAMRAVYGVDTTGDGRIDGWVAPQAGTAWGGAELMDGSAASTANLRQIVAVRIGLVMRSSLVEKQTVAPATIPLFADLTVTGAVPAVNIAAADQTMRHRAIEVTVPIRNLLLR